jgi:hypothetical protein
MGFHKLVIEVEGETIDQAMLKVFKFGPKPLIEKKGSALSNMKGMRKGARFVVFKGNIHDNALKQGVEVSTSKCFVFLPNEGLTLPAHLVEIINNDNSAGSDDTADSEEV